METKTIKIDRKLYICSICKKEYYDSIKEYDDGSLEKINGKEEAEICEKQCQCEHKKVRYNYRHGEFFQRCVGCNKLIAKIEYKKGEKTQVCMKKMYEIAKQYYEEYKHKGQCKCKNKNIKYSFDLSFYQIFFDKECTICNKTLYTINLGTRFDDSDCELNQECMKKMYEIAKQYYEEFIE